VEEEARFWERVRDSDVQCGLCAHRCVIKEGQRGICRVRVNREGRLYTEAYGAVASLAVDPIEKKPLYHFHPGSLAFSISTASCNFRCLHCQNYSLSACGLEDVPYRYMGVRSLLDKAEENRCDGIAYTYNEPTIWYEYTYDCSKKAHDEGLYNVYVTNGYITEEPLREIAPYMDAMNIDIKGNDSFYRKVCKARLEPVLDTCRLARSLGIHTELTYLVIPGYNDDDASVDGFCRFVAEELDNQTPVHFTRFFPYHRMTGVPSTPYQTLLKAYTIAKARKLEFAYIGNVMDREHNNTFCPQCNSLLIERSTFSVRLTGLDGKRCATCGRKIPIVL
jgi:pyruvate formate lyase activating enzyme